MTRKITASIAALGIALSSIATTPAQAFNNNDLNRFIAGAITLAIIGKAFDINLNSNTTRRWPTPTPTPPSKPKIKKPRAYLPMQCYFEVGYGANRKGVFGKKCLAETMRHANWLPRICQERVRIPFGKRADVYDARCMGRQGYRRRAH